MTSQTSRVRQAIQAFIEYQSAANSDVELSQIGMLRSGSDRVHPQLMRFLVDKRESVLEVLESELADAPLASRPGLIHSFLAGTREYLDNNNQFISLSSSDKTELARVYVEYLADMVDILFEQNALAGLAQSFPAIQARHLHCLRAFIARLGEADSSRGERPIDLGAVCAEYSAPLQLSVLGIDKRSLAEPVLGVGCGKNASLVRHLRQAGLDAYGIDRLCSQIHGNPGIAENRGSAVLRARLTVHRAIFTRIRIYHCQQTSARCRGIRQKCLV